MFLIQNQHSNKLSTKQNLIQQINNKQAMSEQLVFKLIEYRNGLYQGITLEENPERLGLFFDDNSALYSSIWRNGSPAGRTVVFFSREQYIYGDWRTGKPNGFNVFRSDGVILLGYYQDGKINGKVILVFQKNSCAVAMSGSQNGSKMLSKKYFSTDEQQKNFITKQFPSLKDPGEYIELIYFLKTTFCQNDGLIKLKVEDGDLKFGFNQGLGVIFDSNKLIERMGVMDKKRKLEGLGVAYKTKNEEGDFETNDIARYEDNLRPQKQIKDIFTKHHKKSIAFKNDYIILKSAELNQYLNKILTLQIMRIPEKQLNEIKKKNNSSIRESRTEQEMLKSIKQQLDRSLGKNKHPSKSPSRGGPKNLFHYSPIATHKYREPQPIQFIQPRSNSPEQNRRMWIDNNHLNDYRKRDIYTDTRPYYGIVSSHHSMYPRKNKSKSKLTKGSKPLLSRQYVSPQIRQISIRKIPVNGVERSQFTQPKRIDVSSIKYKNANSMEVSKKSQYRYLGQQELEQQKEKQRQIKRLNNTKLSQSIQKQIDELPRLYKQTSSKSIKNSGDLPFEMKKGSPQKETGIKSSYQKFKPNQPHCQSPVDKMQDEVDSVEKIKQSKIYQSRYRRYMEDQDPQLNYKYIHTTPQKKTLSPVSVIQLTVSESKQRLPNKIFIETQKQQIVENKDGRILKESRSRKIENEEDNFRNKHSRHNADDKNQVRRKPHQSRSKKVIEIQHERISPEGKKTTTFERIVKKYHYMDEDF